MTWTLKKRHEAMDRAESKGFLTYDGEELGFSHRGCGICNNGLGADLFRAYQVTGEDKNGRPTFEPLAVCTDCICYIANGDEPNDLPEEEDKGVNMNKLPKHLSIFEGSLYDTRKPNWASTPVRENYSKGHSDIKSVADLKATLRSGPYTDLGGYPLYFITSDGAALSFATVRAEFRNVASSIKEETNDGWRVIGCDINYEDNDLYDAHTNEKIESAYGD